MVRGIIYVYIVILCIVTASASPCNCGSKCNDKPKEPCESCKNSCLGNQCQKKNIALGKPTNQSSTYCGGEAYGGPYPSELAVDGNTNGTALHYGCSITDNDKDKEWWKVYLGAYYNISQMTIYLRSDIGPPDDHNQGLNVYVNDDDFCYNLTDTSATKLDITCKAVLYGNVVTVNIPRSDYLALCEVQVFVCSDGWFGSDCDKQCQCRDPSEACDKDTGYCRSGCAAGRQGEGCQQVTTSVPVCHCQPHSQSCPQSPCPSQCQPAWSGTYCQIHNIALGKNASQSSVLKTYGGPYPASLAVDGNTNQSLDGHSCAHTDNTDTNGAKWTVELSSTMTYNISKMEIYFRNANGVRNDGLTVFVDDTQCYKSTKTYIDAISTEDSRLSITCGTVLQGRSVSIHVNGPMLALCEVQVFVCGDGWFGPKCEKHCQCIYPSEVCDKETGYCGCTAGKQGQGCQQDCDDLSYGLGCSKICHCDKNAVCDKVTGNCSNGCAAGKQGSGCQQDCDDLIYGLGCSNTCHCDKNAVCDKVTGNCSNGCAAGKQGSGCQQDCDDLSYGLGCSKTCHCYKNVVCDKVTGNCSNGCAAGKQGSGCQQDCDDLSYGLGCSKTCHCDNNSVCDKVTGNCSNGCAAGKQGSGCQQYCDDFFYGLGCSNTCHCDKNAVCDKVTGNCSNGCAAGKQGSGCQRDCDDLSYGLGCSKTCHCDNNSVCDKVTGNCSNGCAAGKQGSGCQQDCDDLSYGLGCSKTCHCDNNSVCDKVTGNCSNGCAAGKQGSGCQQDCDDLSYGLGCSKTCHCDNNSVCDKVTGNCSNGCAAGKQGSGCQQDCDNLSYGLACSKTCHCYKNAVCDKVTGNCSNGCAAGKQGSGCQQDCDELFYGLGCSNTCHCDNNSVCDKVTGACSNGCAAGKQGFECQRDCADGNFGRDCQMQCHCYNESEVCEKKLGHCESGCASGIQGDDCQRECDMGKYGLRCNNNCGSCINGTCNNTDGTCINGCLPGFQDPFCSEIARETKQPKNVMVIAIGVVAAVVLIGLILVAILIIKRRHQNSPASNKEDSTADISLNNEAGESKRSRNQQNDSQNTPGKNINNVKRNKTSKIQYENIEFVSRQVTIPNHDEDTSNTYYNACPPPIPLANLGQYIKRRLSGVGFENEFKLLRPGLNAAHEEGKKPENKKRNRFLDLFPYDHSRVVLVPDGVAKWDYIHASYISGYLESNIFIAAQGPNPVTVEDFWRMIWQENVSQIVMLTKVMELARKKCEQYWPNENEERTCRNIIIRAGLTTVRADFTIRKFIVHHISNPSDRRLVTQLHFTTWPDHDVPSAPALVGFWKQYRNLHQAQQESSGPVVVHCSAGIGRTGTFIALDSLYDEAERQKKVNVFECVSKMREARLNMVQTASQYRFVHESLLEAVKSKDSFYTSEDFEKKFGTNATYTSAQETAMKKQFESLKSLKMDFNDKQLSDARLPENVNKNKDSTILPANRTRPFLSTQVAERNEYINAVVLPSATRPAGLIATQTPMKNTVLDFWRLVYDHDCFTIVSLDSSTNLYPKKDRSVDCGPFRITHCQADNSCDSFTKIQITLTIIGKIDTTRQITVYKPKFSLGEQTSAFLVFINEVDTKASTDENKLLVQCSDGAHLCGLFCSVLNIVSRLRLDKEVDIFLTIRELQCVRPQFIDTYDQYKCCYDVVKEYHRSSDVYTNM